MIERDKLICSFVGWYAGKHPKIDGRDMRIFIDQKLANANYLPLNDEDLYLIEGLLAETMIHALGSRKNRETRRSVL